MTTNSDRTTAKIYTFPTRGRFAAGQRQAITPIRDFTLRSVRTIVGEAWYHDEAIKEAATDDGRQPRKH